MFILNLRQKNLFFLRHFKNSLPAYLQEMAPRYLPHPLYYWQSLNIFNQNNTRHHKSWQKFLFIYQCNTNTCVSTFMSFLITSECLFKVLGREQKRPFSKTCDSQNVNDPETNIWHFLCPHNSYHSMINTHFFFLLGFATSCFSTKTPKQQNACLPRYITWDIRNPPLLQSTCETDAK